MVTSTNLVSRGQKPVGRHGSCRFWQPPPTRVPCTCGIHPADGAPMSGPHICLYREGAPAYRHGPGPDGCTWKLCSHRQPPRTGNAPSRDLDLSPLPTPAPDLLSLCPVSLYPSCFHSFCCHHRQRNPAVLTELRLLYYQIIQISTLYLRFNMGIPYSGP